MLTAETVVKVMQGNGAFVVAPFLRERVRQAGESPVRHPGCEAYSLRIGRADILAVRPPSIGRTSVPIHLLGRTWLLRLFSLYPCRTA
jgi:hypothetical protein